MSSSPAVLHQQAAKAAARVELMAQTTKRFPPFRLGLPKRVHVPKHVKTAGLRMRIALKTKPRDFRREHLVITTSRTSRDALPLEKLGEWDPEPKMRRLLPSAEQGIEDLSFAGRNATRLEKRIELSGDKIKWWLEKGGAQPTKAVVKLLEQCGLLIRGEHPFSYVPKHREVTEQMPSGHWPEYAEPSPARTKGAAIRGTAYVLPPGGVSSAIKEEAERVTAEAERTLAAELERKRTEKAEAKEKRETEHREAQAAKLKEQEGKWASELEGYRAKVSEVQELKRALDEDERVKAREAAEAAKVEQAAEPAPASASSSSETPAQQQSDEPVSEAERTATSSPPPAEAEPTAAADSPSTPSSLAPEEK